MKEAYLIGKIKEYLKSVEGLFFYKEHGGQYGTGGLPDLIVCYQGHFVAFEVKNEKGKTTVLQEITLRQIRKAGGTAVVVRSMEEVKAVIESLRR